MSFTACDGLFHGLLHCALIAFNGLTAITSLRKGERVEEESCAILAELRRIRALLEPHEPLGFGKRSSHTYIFVKYGPDHLWYSRDREQAANVPIPERDLTGYVRHVWKRARSDETTGEPIEKLNIHVSADREYIIQSGFATNFSKGIVAGLLALPAGALGQPLTLIVEDNAQSSGVRPTVFGRVELQGKRMYPEVKGVDMARLLPELYGKFPELEPPAAPE